MLSDDDIVDVLKKTGVDIARRTVAKYRETMNIHPLSKAAARSVHCRGPHDSEGIPATRKYARAGGSGGSWSEIATSAARFFGPLSFVPPAAGMHSCPIAAKHMRQKFCRSRSRERRKKAPTQSSHTASSPLQRPLGVSSPGHKGFHARRQFVERYSVTTANTTLSVALVGLATRVVRSTIRSISRSNYLKESQ